jgi:hypothetical protein
MKQFQQAAEPRKTDVAWIANLPPLPHISYGKYDADYGSDDSFDLGEAEGTALSSLKQTEFSEAICQKNGAAQLQCLQQAK